MTYNVFSGTLNPTHFTSLLVNVTVENDTRVYGPYPRAVMAKSIDVHCLLPTRPVDTGARYTPYPCLRFVDTGTVYRPSRKHKNLNLKVKTFYFYSLVKLNNWVFT